MAGMSLDWLHEHDGVAWHMFDVLVGSADGLWRGNLRLGCLLTYGQSRRDLEAEPRRRSVLEAAPKPGKNDSADRQHNP